MKTCLLCNTSAPSESVTCAACGEGTFSADRRVPVLAKASPVAVAAVVEAPAADVEPVAEDKPPPVVTRRGRR